MEAVLLIGLYASGKSTFYRQHFFSTHMRINLDLLKTRYREDRLLQLCTETQLRFVVDNTNVTRKQREVYITAAKRAGFRVIGYYFESKIEDCKRRNEQRAAGHQIPLPGLLGTYKRLELPSYEEGFDDLHYVKIAGSDRFAVEE